MAFTSGKIVFHPVCHFVKIVRHFRHQNRFRSGSQTCVQRDISAVASHYFDNGRTLVGGHRITELIDCIYNHAYCCIKADSVVCERNIIINSSRQSHRVDTELAEFVSTLVRAVAADNYKAVNSHFIQDIRAFLLSFRFHEFETSCRLQDGSSTLDNIANAAQIHRENITVQEALVAALNTEYFNTVIDCTANNRANGGVHALGVSSAG
ncbi:hypothetical protein D3C79_827250 [compost metagenome]